jgi:hypothetical protein
MIEARQSDSRLKTLVASAVIGVTCNRGVPTSVMPKGVEHLRPVLIEVEIDRVPTSVMPKGVEHIPATVVR